MINEDLNFKTPLIQNYNKLVFSINVFYEKSSKCAKFVCVCVSVVLLAENCMSRQYKLCTKEFQ